MRKRMVGSALVALAAGGFAAIAAAHDANTRVFEPASAETVVVIERSPRQVYLDEMAQPYAETVQPAYVVVPAEVRADRWDVVVHDGRGMTPAEISRITGKVDSSTAGMPMSGSGAQPGNMGPANSKGQ